MPTTLARMLAATLLVAAGAAQAWSNHALITQAAFGQVAEVRAAAPVQAEPIEAFVQAQAPALERLLADEERWARAQVPSYPARPDALAFRAAGIADAAEARRRFVAALRINPQSRLALFVQRLPGQDDAGRAPLHWSKVTTLQQDHVQMHTRFVALAAGEPVAPLEVLAAASDEPDYGLDVGLWQDSAGAAGPAYGMGKQPFGNPAYEYSGQAPLHMGFYHEAGIIYAAAGFLKRTYPEYRVHLYQSLAAHALKSGHPYWGWRFAGWALHYIQDLTQPYHARVLPGVGVARMLWVNAIDMLGVHGPKDDAVTLVSNRHTALENYELGVLRKAFADAGGAQPLLAAISARGADPMPPWLDGTLREVVSRESHASADAIDAALVAALPARYVADTGYQMGVTEPAIELAEVVARAPSRDSLDALLARLLGRAGAHSRVFVLDLLARSRG